MKTGLNDSKYGQRLQFNYCRLIGCCVIALLLTLDSSASIAYSPTILNPNRNAGQNIDVGLKARYYAECVRHSLQQGQWTATKMISEGLHYASTKLCENESQSKLNELIQSSKKELSQLSTELRNGKRLQQSVGQHLNVAKSHSLTDPALSKMETELARMELNRFTQHNNQSGKRLNQVGQQLVKSEVDYQQVLAECLLDDFKSIFGGAPKPEPDKIPDDEFDGDGIDPELFFYDDYIDMTP